MHNVFKYLREKGTVSLALQSELEQLLQPGVLHRGDFLLRSGDVCRHVWLLTGGLVRCFYYNHNVESTIWFTHENNMILYTEEEGEGPHVNCYIQAIEDCSYYSIPLSSIKDLRERYSGCDAIFAKLGWEYQQKKKLHLQILCTPSSLQRYWIFVQFHQLILSRLKLEYIASYMAVSVRTLINVRKRASNNYNKKKRY